MGSSFSDVLPTGVDIGRLVSASIRAQADEVSRLARSMGAAVSRSDDPAAAAEILQAIAARTIPRWHFSMLNDAARNEALAKAIELNVDRGDHVLDIGTGVGLLAMMAARAGAARVTACEENALLAEIARQVVALHGLSDVVTVIAKRSTELQLGQDIPAPADVIVSEIVDCGIVGEGLLPTMRHAREHLLRPGGRVLPRSLRLRGSLVQSEALAALNRAGWIEGLDVSLVNVVSTRGHFPVRLRHWHHALLSEAVHLLDVDVVAGDLLPGRRVVEVPVRSTGTAHGVVAWFEMDMCENVELSNHPANRDSHWMQALMLFDRPVPVTAGGRLPVELAWTDHRLICTELVEPAR